MATVAAADLTSIIEEVRARVPDYEHLTPANSNLNDEVSIRAERVLDEINMVAGVRYSTADSPLPAGLCHVVATGVIKMWLQDRYRTMPNAAVGELVSMYAEDFGMMLRGLRDGGMQIPDHASDTDHVGMSVASEPRQISSDDTLVAGLTGPPHDVDEVF